MMNCMYIKKEFIYRLHVCGKHLCGKDHSQHTGKAEADIEKASPPGVRTMRAVTSPGTELSQTGTASLTITSKSTIIEARLTMENIP